MTKKKNIPIAKTNGGKSPFAQSAKSFLQSRAFAFGLLLLLAATVWLWRQNRDLLLWLLGRRQRVRVAGRSMLPTFQPGQELFVDSHAYRHATPQEGDVVVAWHPRKPEMKIVKRVSAVLENGRLLLAGDNPAESSDSRHFGAIATAQIIGKITGQFG